MKLYEEKKQEVVGILGGMGPYATLMFFQKILDLTPARKDWEHAHLIIDNASHIPSRTRHFLYGEDSPVPKMIECCKRLENYPVDFIAIPCNSATFYLNEITPHIKIPIVSIIDTTVDSLSKYNISNASCVVLGGRVTYASSSYKVPLERNGHTYLHHDEMDQLEIESIIESIKIQNTSKGLTHQYVTILKKMKDHYGAEVVILGCTELTIFTEKVNGIRIIDSSEELASFIVEKNREFKEE